MTHFVNPKEVEGDLVAVSRRTSPRAAPTTASSASATSKVMRQALECCHKGWGVSRHHRRGRRRRRRSARGRSSSSPAACGKARPSAARAGRTDVPKIVDWYMDGKINIDDLITHTMPLDDINKGFDLMHARRVDPQRRRLLACPVYHSRRSPHPAPPPGGSTSPRSVPCRSRRAPPTRRNSWRRCSAQV